MYFATARKLTMYCVVAIALVVGLTGCGDNITNVTENSGIGGDGGSGGNGGGGGNGGSGEIIEPVGEYFVTEFIAANRADAEDTLDAQGFGLSLYMTLNADNTLAATVQSPSNPSQAVALTGTWTKDGENSISLLLIDPNSVVRKISGTLGRAENQEIYFTGAQTAGAPFSFPGETGFFSISGFAMIQYPNPLTVADLAGTYLVSSAMVYSNQDPNQRADILSPGFSQTVEIMESGAFKVTTVEDNNAPEVFTGTLSLSDSFHVTFKIDNGPEVTQVFRLANETLSTYNYETEFLFPTEQQPESATQIFQYSKY